MHFALIKVSKNRALPQDLAGALRLHLTLEQVVQWYATRDLNNNSGNNPTPLAAGPGGNPYVAMGTFYTAADGSPDRHQYNDLPVQFDGYDPANPAAYAAPAQCQLATAAATATP